MSAEDKFQSAAGPHQSCGQIHQFLHDGFYPAPFGETAHGGFSRNEKMGSPMKRENGAGREERNAAGRTLERLELIIEAANKLLKDQLRN